MKPPTTKHDVSGKQMWSRANIRIRPGPDYSVSRDEKTRTLPMVSKQFRKMTRKDRTEHGSMVVSGH